MSGFDRFLEAAAHDFVRNEPEPEIGVHLTREVLSDYRSRRVGGAERERIQDHLVACPECADALLYLMARNPAPSWWQRASSNFIGIARQPVPAVLSLAVIALGLWNVSLERAYRQASRPQVGASVVEIFAGPSRGQADAAKEIPFGRDAWMFTLVLHLPDPGPRSTFDLELTDAPGNVLWRTGALPADADGSVTISIPRPAIGKARDLRIRLLESGTRSIAAVYAIRLVDS